MSLSRYPQITEELLSAYLDDLVSAEEQLMIEQAVANDPQIAWQLDSLRQTVHLLQSLPALALPRSFTLDAATIAALVEREPQGVPVPETTSTTRESWWQRLITALQGNSPVLRTAAAAAAVLLVILVASSWLLSPTPDAPQIAQSSAPTEMAVASAGNGTTDNEVASSETATILVATVPVVNRTQGSPSPTVVINAGDQALAQATGTPANEARVNSDPQRESAPLASAAAPNGVATQSTQPTPATEVPALAQNQSAPETSALAQAAPVQPAVELATATQPVATQYAPGDDTQPLEGFVASQNETATAFNAAVPDNTMANGVATDDDQATVTAAKTAGTAQEAGTATEIAIAVEAVAQESVPQDDQSATEVIVTPEEANTEKEPLLRAAKVTTQSVTALAPLTATIELTTSADVSDEVARDDLIAATLTTTMPVTSSVAITNISPASVASDLLVTAVVTTVVAAIETTAIDESDPSPVLTKTALTETMPATATIATVMPDRKSVTDIITATVALLPQQTATKPATRRTAVATATTMPLRTPTALPQVMSNDALPATLTAQVPITATNTPTVTTTPAVTGTITATATVTGTLTPVGTPLGQQPIIILMSANIDAERTQQGTVLFAVQSLVSLLVIALGVLWWRCYTTVGHR